MGFLSRVLGSDQGGDDTIIFKAPVETGGIAYDPGLVARLKQEHQELVSLFMAIKNASAECRFHQLPGLLQDLKQLFQTHIMLENVKFYVYVQQYCVPDPETSNFVFDVRKDMNGIARTLVKFVNTHSANVPTLDTVGAFRAELDLIGSLLLRRVHLEESRLYALYQPAVQRGGVSPLTSTQS